MGERGWNSKVKRSGFKYGLFKRSGFRYGKKGKGGENFLEWGRLHGLGEQSLCYTPKPPRPAPLPQ